MINTQVIKMKTQTLSKPTLFTPVKELADTPDVPSGVITREEAKTLIKATQGKFFTVTFIKKDNTKRVMNARLGVKTHLKGGVLPYNAEAKGFITVWDPTSKSGSDSGYRQINVSTISNLKIGRKEYNVK